MDACPGHILESTKGIEMNLIYRWMAVKERTMHANHSPILYIYSVISPKQFNFVLESAKGMEMKLGLQIDDSMRKGSAQEP